MYALFLFQALESIKTDQRVFNLIHIQHEMAEFGLNASHRYSSKKSQTKRNEEYQYILSSLRNNTIDYSKNRSCLAAIPSTGSWTYIDCQKIFSNVTYICKYSSFAKEAQFIKDTCDETNGEYYCEKGWILGHRHCLQIVYVKAKEINKGLILSTCDKISSFGIAGKEIINQ